MAEITLHNVNVEYPIFNENHYSLRRILVNYLSRGKIYKNERSLNIVSALRNISFSLKSGDRLGLVGNNGAGKSTLLKTLAHLYIPSSGKMTIEGKISALFDVCLGMDMERTGYHNIYYMGALLGLSKKQIKSFIPDIEQFSELGSFLKMPVRTYSAGMKVRLGFALCTCLHPTILLLDEAIGAGDKHFLEKALDRAKTLYDRAEIMVLASHSNDIIRDFCNKVLWLHQGEIKMLGNVDEVLSAYSASSL